MKNRYSRTYLGIIVMLVTAILSFEIYAYAMGVSEILTIKFKTMDNILNGNS